MPRRLAITIDTDDGRLTNVRGSIGGIHTCFGATVDSTVIDFSRRESWLQFTGHRECRANRADVPEAGVAAYKVLSPASRRPDWIRSQLTTSTITSGAATGELSDPLATSSLPGTVRLWKKPQQSSNWIRLCLGVAHRGWADRSCLVAKYFPKSALPRWKPLRRQDLCGGQDFPSWNQNGGLAFARKGSR
jgi:hypothetical protein